jgi:putative DNA primase/helicase
MTSPHVFGKWTDTSVAELWAKRVGQRFRYEPVNRLWREHDGIRYRIDHRGAAVESLKTTISEAAKAAIDTGDSTLAREVLAWHKMPRLMAALKLAESIPGVPVLPHELDADPWLLNTESHTIDLRTGQARDHSPADLITKVCPTVYDPDATCPRWLAFLGRIFGGSEALIGLMQRIFGACLAGVTRENVFLVFHGGGSNGKTVLITVLLRLSGDYGLSIRPEVFLDRESDPQGFGLADLPGVRVVTAAETRRDGKLNEALVKTTTGRDRLRVAHKFGQFFEFTPVFTPILVTNHRPTIEGQDHAIWRRVKLVPFNVTIPDHEQDHGLADRLMGELPGILNWALDGCLAWQREGFGFPDEVIQATADYRAEQDVLGDWLEARCVVRPDVEDEFGGLYADYVGFSGDRNEQPVNQTRFRMSLDERGFAPVKRSKGVRHRRGIARRTPANAHLPSLGPHGVATPVGADEWGTV